MVNEKTPTEPARSSQRARPSRLLFVDDDPYVLASIRRLLRSLRPEWEVVTAPHAGEALKKLGSRHFDVVVTDITMPGLDGATLLEIVADSYPDVIRVLHSSHAADLVGQPARYLADYLLPKPASAEELLEALDSALPSGPTSQEDSGQAAS